MSYRLALSMVLMFSLTIATLYIFLSNLSHSLCTSALFNKSTRYFTPSQLLIWLYTTLFLFLKSCSFILSKKVLYKGFIYFIFLNYIFKITNLVGFVVLLQEPNVFVV